MTPDLEDALNKIGWPKARHHPFAVGWRLTLQPKGGLISSTAPEAEAAKARLDTLWNAIQFVLSEFEALPPDTREAINLASTPPDERDGGWPDHLEAATAALRNLEDGLITWATGLDQAAGLKTDGRPRNEPAYRVANVLAEIYFVGTGEMPGVGPSTPFVRATKEILKILGIRCDYVVRPCEKSRASLTEERKSEIVAGWTARPVSFSDFWYMQNPQA